MFGCAAALEDALVNSTVLSRVRNIDPK